MNNKHFSAKRITLAGVCVALYVVMSTFLSITMGGLKLTFEHLPVILVAVLFGPVDGLIVGGLGELINQMLTFGFTPTTVLWMLPAMFRGLSVGLASKLLGEKLGLSKKVPAVFLILCVVSGLICSCINTFAFYVDSKMFGYYSYAMVFGVLGVRLIASALSSVVMALATKPLVNGMTKARII